MITHMPRGDERHGTSHLTVSEWLAVARRAVHDDAALVRVLEVLEHHSVMCEKALGAGAAVLHAGGVALHGHRTFLPWAKRYRDHLVHGRGVGDADYRRVRAGLGGASRWLYARQKQTFVDLVHLIVPFGSHVPQHTLDEVWAHIQARESRLLARSRSRT